MDCPHGWTDCELCVNFYKCKSGTYIPEPDEPDPEPILELEEDELTTDLGVTIPQERGTWAERFLNMSEEERWKEYYKHHPDDLVSKEPYKAMAGAIAPGGSKTGKVKKSKKGTKIVIEPWTSEV